MSTARKLILYVIYFVIIVALGIVIILAFTQHDSKKNPIAAGPKVIRVAPSKPDQPIPSDNTSRSPATPPSTAPSTATAGESTRSAIVSATTAPTALANSGPGDVLLLFGLTTLVAAAGYRRHLIAQAVK